jgi:DNA-binding Lrp family transcriptional regulator
MPKVSKRQKELDERKVVAELQNNANESIDKLAKRCGFSRQKVWRIIKKLESNKTIWGYHAVVDNEKLQTKNYILLLKKTNKPVSELLNLIVSRELEKQAKDLGVTIESSSYLHGSFDWMVSFVTEDIKQAKRFVEIFNRLYQNYVGEIFLFEEIFPVKTCGINNPHVDRLKDFA